MSDIVTVGIVLLNSTFASDKYFNCSEDICLTGRDYCDTFHHRCALCSDHQENCFTNRQQQNCTQFCMDGWTKQHQTNCGSQNVEGSVWKYVAIVESSLLFLMVIMLIVYLLRSRLKSCFRRCYRNPEDGPANTEQSDGTNLTKLESIEALLEPDAPNNNDSTSIISPSVNDTCSCFTVYVLLVISVLVNCYCVFVWCRSNQATKQVPCRRCIGVPAHVKSKPSPGTIRRKNRRRKKRRRNRVRQYDCVRGELSPEDVHSTI